MLQAIGARIREANERCPRHADERSVRCAGGSVNYGIWYVSAIATWMALTPSLRGAERESAKGVSWDRTAERVVHRFDFDERDEGNLEDIPKFWEPFRPPGFPHYAGGGFDFDIGHAAPPSFHLSTEGRNVAFQYRGPDTRVRENSEYRIEGWIKPDRLRHARACLSAFFVDRFGHVLPETIVRSTYIGGDSDAWQSVDLHLPAAPPRAFSVGLAVWVVQRSVWDTSPRPAHHIPHRDVFGGAWFDDITIYRLPHVALISSDPTNVLEAGKRQDLYITLADHDDRALGGTLSIYDADGGLVETHTLPVVLDPDAPPHTVSVAHLDPGSYRAELVVTAHGHSITTRTLDFVRVAPRFSDQEATARSFGVSLDPVMRADPDIEGRLLLRQGVHSVKFPVWTGRADMRPDPTRQRRTDRMFQQLVQRNFVTTAVLHGAPALIVQSAGPYAPSLLDLLSTTPESWEQHLAAVAAPYAGTFRWWQIGADGEGTVLTFERLNDVLGNVRLALRPFITNPRLAAPGDALVTRPRLDSTLDQITLTLGAFTPPNQYAPIVRAWRNNSSELISAYVPPLAEDRYLRGPRLADWARRVILARHAGVHTVYVPQTWRTRETAVGSVTEPAETFLWLRTMADIIGDRTPGPELYIEGIRCVTFRDEQHSVLALWAEHAGSASIRQSVQLGRAGRQIDLRGVATALERDEDGLPVVHATGEPIFIDGVENWLIDLATSLTMKPEHVEAGTEHVAVTLEWAYRGSLELAGRVSFSLPESWSVEPRELDIRLTPNRIERRHVNLRLPPTETAGRKGFYVHLRLNNPAYTVDIPLSFDLGLRGLEVWGMAYVDGDQLVLQHAITNNSAETVSFRSAASVPGRERQYRPFTGLAPGETQSTMFRFENGRELIGRRVQVVLRELNDGQRTHTLELLVP